MKNSKPRLITANRPVNMAVEISQIDDELAELRERMRVLKAKKEGLVNKLSSKYGKQFQFRDGNDKLFQVDFTPRKREYLDEELAREIIDEAGYEIPIKTARWLDAKVRPVKL